MTEPDPLIGKVLNGYRIERLLEPSRSGNLYKATQILDRVTFLVSEADDISGV